MNEIKPEEIKHKKNYKFTFVLDFQYSDENLKELEECFSIAYWHNDEPIKYDEQRFQEVLKHFSIGRHGDLFKMELFGYNYYDESIGDTIRVAIDKVDNFIKRSKKKIKIKEIKIEYLNEAKNE